MSKKKSYMSEKNIFREGIVTGTIEKIFKKIIAPRALKKNKNFQSSLNDLNNSISDLEKHINNEYKKIGSKKRVNLKPYKSKDFLGK
jgi:peptidoglycan hydrolase CwlO-like protein